MIAVERTAPLLTVQDAGRTGFLADGVTRSGPLDPLALIVGNALVGNGARAAALEGCLGGARFRFARDATFALTGADVVATLDATRVATYAACDACAGSVLTIERVERGAIWYLAVRGGIDVPLVLGSRSTLLSAALGGVDGGPVRTGAELALASDIARQATRVAVPPALRAQLDDGAIPLAPAPRTDALSVDEWRAFYESTFTVTHATSRVGYRLEGPVVPSHLPADLASEPACAGAMQLPPEGQPIVLMADHPTIGGYPIIGVVPAHAIGRVAQCAPGARVRFAPASVDDAVARGRAHREIVRRWLATL